MSFLSYESRTVTSAGYPEGLVQLKYRSSADGEEDDALIMPSKDDRWIISVHGFGGKSNQLFIRTDIKKAWLPCYLERGLGILSPTMRGNTWMQEECVNDMDDMLEYVRETYGGRRFYFCSGSLGGTNSLMYAGLRPQNVSGVIAHGAASEMSEYYEFCIRHQVEQPMLAEVAASIAESFSGKPDETPGIYRAHSAQYIHEVLKEIPIYLLHGGADELMPVEQSRRFAEIMSDAKRFKYVEMPGANHVTPIGVSEGYSWQKDSPLSWLLN